MNPRHLDETITRLHLQDDSLYRTSTAEEFLKQYRRLNRERVRIAKAAVLSPSIISRLKIELPVCPGLYLLFKTHKLSDDRDLSSNDPSTFKVRPIISGARDSTDRIAWFLNLVFVHYQNSYLLTSVTRKCS